MTRSACVIVLSQTHHFGAKVLVDLESLLKQHFGHSEFRGPQREIIDSVLQNQNTLVVMPTGMGKSLTYQMPSLVLDGLTLVITPLIALFMNGHYEWAEVYPLMVFITLYSYAYTAFMAAHVMRIPMELACFIAIAGMAIHQTSLDVLKWAAVGFIQLIA